MGQGGSWKGLLQAFVQNLESRFWPLCGEGGRRRRSPPRSRCPIALLGKFGWQDYFPSGVKLFLGAFAFIFFTGFLKKNFFFQLSLAVHPWPSPRIFEGRFLTPPFSRVLFQPVSISPGSKLKNNQGKKIPKPEIEIQDRSGGSPAPLAGAGGGRGCP